MGQINCLYSIWNILHKIPIKNLVNIPFYRRERLKQLNPFPVPLIQLVPSF